MAQKSVINVQVPKALHKRCKLKMVDEEEGMTFTYLVVKALYDYLGEEFDWDEVQEVKKKEKYGTLNER